MLKSRDRTILLGIVQYSERILSKIRNVCLRDFEENEDLKEIICFNLLQIGDSYTKYVFLRKISRTSMGP